MVEAYFRVKYLGLCWMNVAQKCNMLQECVNGRKVAVAIRFLVNARSLQRECARMLNEAFLILVLLYGSETMVLREKKRSRIRVVQLDNLRGLLGVRRRDRVLKVKIRELYGVVKG